MKNLYLLFSLFVVFCHQGQCQTKATEIDYNKEASSKIKKLKVPKEVKPYLENMVLISGGTFIMGEFPFSSNLKATARDSNLLISQNPRQVTVSGFYLSQKEVTNKEWREFYSAKLEELGAEKAAKYLPDTLLWKKEFPYSFNDPMVEYYYYHPAYDNYPVLGVSWVQAQAFCEWKSAHVNSILAANGIDPLPNFRLPTEAEWEFAAKGLWREDMNAVEIKKETYSKLNMGAIYDQNGLQIKDYIDDGGIYTTHVGFYSPNDYGLYDMSGNVSEWVQDVARSFSNIKLEEEVTRDSVFDRLVARDMQQGAKIIMDKETKAYYEKLVDNILHDWEMIKKSTVSNAKKEDQLHIVKGGSWADPLLYQHPASRQIWASNKGSCRIGFRVAMTRIGTSDPRLGQGNGWRAHQAALLPKGHSYNPKKNSSKAKW